MTASGECIYSNDTKIIYSGIIEHGHNARTTLPPWLTVRYCLVIDVSITMSGPNFSASILRPFLRGIDIRS